MASINDLCNELLEMVFVRVVAGAKTKYSEMDKLTKVSARWSDVIYSSGKAMKVPH